MVELISSRRSKAKKEHICNYCGELITVGEVYNNDFCKYAGETYTFKSHQKCREVADELYDFIDPSDYGITEDDFWEGCTQFCRQFICSECVHWLRDYDECDLEKSYCIDKVHKLLKTHCLIRSVDKHGMSCHKLVNRENTHDQ